MTKKRAIVALISAFAVIVGIAIFGGNAGATSYYDDEQHCYISDCETTTTTEYEETTTTEVTTTTVQETTTTTSTIPELPEPELIPPLIIERELPPYVAPMPPVQTPATPAPLSFTG